MHSSRMHSTHSSSHQLERSASVHVGIHPLGVGLETPQVWAWRPHRCEPGDPTGVSLENHQVWACRPPLARPLNAPLWVWSWKPARHAGIPTIPRRPARHAGMPPARYAGIPPPPVNRITDACKNITFPQLRLLAVKHVNNV